MPKWIHLTGSHTERALKVIKKLFSIFSMCRYYDFYDVTKCQHGLLKKKSWDISASVKIYMIKIGRLKEVIINIISKIFSVFLLIFITLEALPYGTILHKYNTNTIISKLKFEKAKTCKWQSKQHLKLKRCSKLS